MKLGYIDYLNCYPYYYHMFEKSPLPGVEIIPDYPSKLNKMMADSNLDLSPVSSASYASSADHLLILPQFCLSSVGYVASVVLYSRVPIEELDRRRVALTNASHTSVVLLKLLLEKFFALQPDYQIAGAKASLQDVDAALVIGNDALTMPPVETRYAYDLADLWLKKTGFPVVFALFAVTKEAAGKYAPQIDMIIESFFLSLNCLGEQRDLMIRKARRKYPDIQYDFETYFSHLHFTFSDKLKEALLYYYQLGTEQGLIAKVDQVEFYDQSSNLNNYRVVRAG